MNVLPVLVAPPRGERGLKLGPQPLALCVLAGRSPSWGAWIEISFGGSGSGIQCGRSPSWGAWIEMQSLSAVRNIPLSLPLVGSVD